MIYKNFKYGIIGCGRMGQEHIKNILYLKTTGEKCIIEAICDPNKGSITETFDLLKRYQKNVKVYNNYIDLVNDISINIVIIAVPNYKHYEILNYCLINKKNILIEKPICTTIKDCVNIYNQLKSSDSYDITPLLWIGMQFMYIKPIQELLNKVKLNNIGNVKMISIKEHTYPSPNKVDNWNTEFKKTGGAILERCTHLFHLMYLLAVSKPVSVYASGYLNVNIRDKQFYNMKTDLVDNAYAIVNFENGIRANLDICMFAEGSEDQSQLCAVGDKGKIEVFLPKNKILISKRPDNEDKINNIPHNIENKLIEEYYLQEDEEIIQLGYNFGGTYWQHFNYLQSLKFSKKANVDYKQGLIAVIIAIAIELSIKENRLINLSELISDKILSEMVDLNE